jgi:hypothetical protein
MQRSKVDLPLPEGPIKPTTIPRETEAVTPEITACEP